MNFNNYKIIPGFPLTASTPVVILCIALFFSLSLGSCSKFSQMKRQENQRRKKLEKENERKEKEAQKAYEAAIKRHYAIQDASTQKMMKQTARKSYNASHNKKECFLKRWFTPKHRKKKSNRQEG